MSNNLIKSLLKLANSIDREINLMEFCGTHTHEIFRYGIRQLFPDHIHLLSGPGCPVCVTAEEDIDYTITLAVKGFGIITFGDLVNVPGSDGSLNYLKAMGKDVRVIYSPLDSIKIAGENPGKDFVLVGIGFETTAPTLAYTIEKIKEKSIKNLYFLSLHKLTPPAMKAIIEMGEVRLDGIIGPGHVSTIIGVEGWMEIVKYGIPFVIAGFKPLEILEGLYFLLKMIAEKQSGIYNAYPHSVRKEGNTKALELMYKVFKKGEANWRGLGVIEESGLELREEYADLDIKRIVPYEGHTVKSTACRCGEVLRGVISPPECPLFEKVCTPSTPRGPCMVSSEGTCSAYYHFGRR